jgi:predicted esterase YcpF (UPF0227 family)
MKHALYIYGYGSNENSTTKENLQKILGPSWNVDSVYYEQRQPNEAIEYLSNIAENYNAVIGSSLGGFYTLKINFNGPKVVINPCMMPSIELPKIGCPLEIAKRFEKFETFEKNKNVLGLFGTHDELINYRGKFKVAIDGACVDFGSGHRPTLDELMKCKYIIQAWI